MIEENNYSSNENYYVKSYDFQYSVNSVSEMIQNPFFNENFNEIDFQNRIYDPYLEWMMISRESDDLSDDLPDDLPDDSTCESSINSIEIELNNDSKELMDYFNDYDLNPESDVEDVEDVINILKEHY